MKIMLILLLSLRILNSSSILIFANENQKENLLKIVKEFKSSNSLLVSPENPFSTKPILLYDLNQDGQKEIIVTFQIKAKEQPSLSQFGVMVLKRENNNWQKIWETKTQGVGLEFSGLADITGDGIKEYLFGVTIGAAAGNKLEVFQWNDNSFKKIADVPYHKMDILNGNQKVGLAIWQWYLTDSYLVDTLKWNGKKLTFNEDLYSQYYPIIEKFYSDKISKMDAWFYWYCLADAQIKANLLEEAANSIHKGHSLAKQLSMPDVVQNFNELTNRLKEKKKHFSN
ncbi:hypothetical protein COE51_03435 [Bacillus pseudomycoides]|nr:hypothetical protein COE51_03435 [Bacillus pseudomycoides]